MNLSIPKSSLAIPVIILFCFLTRLPQLLSPHLVLDGDEAIVALMAKHLVQGKEISFYFWGQNYGFSFVEVLFIAPFYLLFGIGDMQVKLGMLSLWTVGVVFLYKAMLALSKKDATIPFLLILLFISIPAWAVWSMKARGGYVSAFTLSTIIMFLLTRYGESKRLLPFIVAGVLTVLLYESQRFWIVGLAPLLFYVLFVKRRWKQAVAAVSAIVVVAAVFYWYKTANLPDHSPQAFIPDHGRWVGQVLRFPSYLYQSLHGNYYFTHYMKPNLFCAIGALISFALVLFVLTMAVALLGRRRRGSGFFIFSAAGVFGIFLLSLFFERMEGRYLLPITGYAFFSLAVYLRDSSLAGYLRPFAVGILLTGFVTIGSFYSFYHSNMGNRQSISKLIAILKKNKVKHVFSIDTMLPYQLAFYSNETIIGREIYVPGRRFEYLHEVNEAHRKGLPTAIIGFQWNLEWNPVPDIQPVDDLFYVLKPKEEVLQQFFYF